MSEASASRSFTVALVGNPNAGKSTIFNRLTGLRQRIGNYPGVTVERKSGLLLHEGREANVLDLPGTYSLAAHSLDQRVVVDALEGLIGPVPDLVVCVLDACQLKRNLFLVTQIAEMELPMVVVLNQIDAARKQGVVLDAALLETRLGVPVVSTVASVGEGIDCLKNAIFAARERPRTMQRIEWPQSVRHAFDQLRSVVDEGVGDSDLQRILFDSDSAVAERVFQGRDRHQSVVARARESLASDGLNPGSAEAVLIYRHLDSLVEGTIRLSGAAPQSTSESIDKLLLHRFWGTVVFAGIMWVVFQSVYAWAGPLMDGIEFLTGQLQAVVAPWFDSMPKLQSLIVDGVIAGVGGVVVFLPQIFVLFLFIGLLEDTGYMARAAFLMDKLFGWCGLNGKSFVPMLSSYACAIPGIMAARTLSDPKARLITILLAPLMSCSARLPVYVLLIGAFIEPTYGQAVAGWVLFGMHLVGLFVALPLAWFMSRVVMKMKALPFVLELPPYRTPRVKDLGLRMWEGGREFLSRAGTVILAFSIIIWALLYYPRGDAVAEQARTEFIDASGLSETEAASRLADPESEFSQELDHWVEGAYVEQSYMGRIGKAVQPLFDPAGFDWKISVGALASFPAREVIIATLGIIYHLGAEVDEESEDLTAVMAGEVWREGPRAGQPVFTIPVVVAIMVFFALCMQCGATVAVIKKELDWRWAAASFCGMTTMAWVAAIVVYQVGSLIS